MGSVKVAAVSPPGVGRHRTASGFALLPSVPSSPSSFASSSSTNGRDASTSTPARVSSPVSETRAASASGGTHRAAGHDGALSSRNGEESRSESPKVRSPTRCSTPSPGRDGGEPVDGDKGRGRTSLRCPSSGGLTASSRASSVHAETTCGSFSPGNSSASAACRRNDSQAPKQDEVRDSFSSRGCRTDQEQSSGPGEETPLWSLGSVRRSSRLNQVGADSEQRVSAPSLDAAALPLRSPQQLLLPTCAQASSPTSGVSTRRGAVGGPASGAQRVKADRAEVAGPRRGSSKADRDAASDGLRSEEKNCDENFPSALFGDSRNTPRALTPVTRATASRLPASALVPASPLSRHRQTPRKVSPPEGLSGRHHRRGVRGKLKQETAAQKRNRDGEREKKDCSSASGPGKKAARGGGKAAGPLGRRPSRFQSLDVTQCVAPDGEKKAPTSTATLPCGTSLRGGATLDAPLCFASSTDASPASSFSLSRHNTPRNGIPRGEEREDSSALPVAGRTRSFLAFPQQKEASEYTMLSRLRGGREAAPTRALVRTAPANRREDSVAESRSRVGYGSAVAPGSEETGDRGERGNSGASEGDREGGKGGELADVEVKLEEREERSGVVLSGVANCAFEVVTVEEVARRRKKHVARTQRLSARAQREQERLRDILQKQFGKRGSFWGGCGWVPASSAAKATSGVSTPHRSPQVASHTWQPFIFCPYFGEEHRRVYRHRHPRLYKALLACVQEGKVHDGVQVIRLLDFRHPVRLVTPEGEDAYSLRYVGPRISAEHRERIIFGEYTGYVSSDEDLRADHPQYCFQLKFHREAFRDPQVVRTQAEGMQSPQRAARRTDREERSEGRGSGEEGRGERERGEGTCQDEETYRDWDAKEDWKGAASSVAPSVVTIPHDEMYAVDSTEEFNEMSMVNHFQTVDLFGGRKCRINAEWQVVYVDAWPHIVLTSIPGVAINPGEELLADFGFDWFAQINAECMRYCRRELQALRLRDKLSPQALRAFLREQEAADDEEDEAFSSDQLCFLCYANQKPCKVALTGEAQNKKKVKRSESASGASTLHDTRDSTQKSREEEATEKAVGEKEQETTGSAASVPPGGGGREDAHGSEREEKTGKSGSAGDQQKWLHATNRQIVKRTWEERRVGETRGTERREKEERGIVCDGCNRAYHLECIHRTQDPPADEFEWFCPLCILFAERVNAARQARKDEEREAESSALKMSEDAEETRRASRDEAAERETHLGNNQHSPCATDGRILFSHGSRSSSPSSSSASSSLPSSPCCLSSSSSSCSSASLITGAGSSQPSSHEASVENGSVRLVFAEASRLCPPSAADAESSPGPDMPNSLSCLSSGAAVPLSSSSLSSSLSSSSLSSSSLSSASLSSTSLSSSSLPVISSPEHERKPQAVLVEEEPGEPADISPPHAAPCVASKEARTNAKAFQAPSCSVSSPPLPCLPSPSSPVDRHRGEAENVCVIPQSLSDVSSSVSSSSSSSSSLSSSSSSSSSLSSSSPSSSSFSSSSSSSSSSFSSSSSSSSVSSSSSSSLSSWVSPTKAEDVGESPRVVKPRVVFSSVAEAFASQAKKIRVRPPPSVNEMGAGRQRGKLTDQPTLPESPHLSTLLPCRACRSRFGDDASGVTCRIFKLHLAKNFSDPGEEPATETPLEICHDIITAMRNVVMDYRREELEAAKAAAAPSPSNECALGHTKTGEETEDGSVEGRAFPELVSGEDLLARMSRPSHRFVPLLGVYLGETKLERRRPTGVHVGKVAGLIRDAEAGAPKIVVKYEDGDQEVFSPKFFMTELLCQALRPRQHQGASPFEVLFRADMYPYISRETRRHTRLPLPQSSLCSEEGGCGEETPRVARRRASVENEVLVALALSGALSEAGAQFSEGRSAVDCFLGVDEEEEEGEAEGVAEAFEERHRRVERGAEHDWGSLFCFLSACLPLLIVEPGEKRSRRLFSLPGGAVETLALLRETKRRGAGQDLAHLPFLELLSSFVARVSSNGDSPSGPSDATASPKRRRLGAKAEDGARGDKSRERRPRDHAVALKDWLSELEKSSDSSRSDAPAALWGPTGVLPPLGLYLSPDEEIELDSDTDVHSALPSSSLSSSRWPLRASCVSPPCLPVFPRPHTRAVAAAVASAAAEFVAMVLKSRLGSPAVDEKSEKPRDVASRFLARSVNLSLRNKELEETTVRAWLDCTSHLATATLARAWVDDGAKECARGDTAGSREEAAASKALWVDHGRTPGRDRAFRDRRAGKDSSEPFADSAKGAARQSQRFLRAGRSESPSNRAHTFSSSESRRSRFPDPSASCTSPSSFSSAASSPLSSARGPCAGFPPLALPSSLLSSPGVAFPPPNQPGDRRASSALGPSSLRRSLSCQEGVWGPHAPANKVSSQGRETLGSSVGRAWYEAATDAWVAEFVRENGKLGRKRFLCEKLGAARAERLAKIKARLLAAEGEGPLSRHELLLMQRHQQLISLHREGEARLKRERRQQASADSADSDERGEGLGAWGAGKRRRARCGPGGEVAPDAFVSAPSVSSFSSASTEESSETASLLGEKNVERRDRYGSLSGESFPPVSSGCPTLAPLPGTRPGSLGFPPPREEPRGPCSPGAGPGRPPVSPALGPLPWASYTPLQTSQSFPPSYSSGRNGPSAYSYASGVSSVRDAARVGFPSPFPGETSFASGGSPFLTALPSPSVSFASPPLQPAPLTFAAQQSICVDALLALARCRASAGGTAAGAAGPGSWAGFSALFAFLSERGMTPNSLAPFWAAIQRLFLSVGCVVSSADLPRVHGLVKAAVTRNPSLGEAVAKELDAALEQSQRKSERGEVLRTERGIRGDGPRQAEGREQGDRAQDEVETGKKEGEELRGEDKGAETRRQDAAGDGRRVGTCSGLQAREGPGVSLRESTTHLFVDGEDDEGLEGGDTFPSRPTPTPGLLETTPPAGASCPVGVVSCSPAGDASCSALSSPRFVPAASSALPEESTRSAGWFFPSQNGRAFDSCLLSPPAGAALQTHALVGLDGDVPACDDQVERRPNAELLLPSCEDLGSRREDASPRYLLHPANLPSLSPAQLEDASLLRLTCSGASAGDAFLAPEKKKADEEEAAAVCGLFS
ncbi:AP2 domain transcription factor AP2VIIa-7 [Toxoplasma gondii VAND]|uniref:AP2 domain transcription factor AP2VIIa-7 n=1 Tax=Toxoplasma gondii VAND TaxID=933077 RepID=A0A086Q336_TOXGO|nr:AP2 domain transcription factor AP2VIIa-7 [Toxoplasma gondii VAND]